MDKIEVTESIFLYNNNNLVGDLRSATYSPNLKKVVGIAMVKKEYWDKKTPIELKIGDKKIDDIFSPPEIIISFDLS